MNDSDISLETPAQDSATPAMSAKIDDAALAGMTPATLIDWLLAHEDRVPRNVIDACAQRGDAMAGALAPWAQPDRRQETDHPGRWWLRLHAVMILGLIPGERAGDMLLAFIRDLCDEDDENLPEWFAGYWPALTRNKPASLVAPLWDICADRRIDWFMRINLFDAVLAFAHCEGEAALDAALDWAAQFAADETEDWNMRLLAAGHLLDFPRARHLELLHKLAAMQHGLGRHFDQSDINNAFARGTDRPGWERFDNPWRFYEPQAIEARQERWAKEDREIIDSDYLEDRYYHLPTTYIRETPKVGRNDPCPCGSGKKYKKCCGAR